MGSCLTKMFSFRKYNNDIEISLLSTDEAPYFELEDVQEYTFNERISILINKLVDLSSSDAIDELLSNLYGENTTKYYKEAELYVSFTSNNVSREYSRQKIIEYYKLHGESGLIELKHHWSMLNSDYYTANEYSIDFNKLY